MDKITHARDDVYISQICEHNCSEANEVKKQMLLNNYVISGCMKLIFVIHVHMFILSIKVVGNF